MRVINIISCHTDFMTALGAYMYIVIDIKVVTIEQECSITIPQPLKANKSLVHDQYACSILSDK